MVDTFRVNRQEVNHVLHLHPTPYPLQSSRLSGPIVIVLHGVASDFFFEMKLKDQERGWLDSMVHAGVDSVGIELDHKLCVAVLISGCLLGISLWIMLCFCFLIPIFKNHKLKKKFLMKYYNLALASLLSG